MSYYQINDNIIEYYGASPSTKSFKPYSMNGGSYLAIAGEDFTIIGADTRLSYEFSIIKRDQKKLFKLSDTSVLGASGCWADILTVSRTLQIRMAMYKQEHNKTMSTPAVAQMLSTILYYKRFFPYYVMSIVAGLDDKGKGCVFSYDPVGHCEQCEFKAGGTAGPLLQPLLDNQIGQNNMQQPIKKPISREFAVSLLKDGFTSAAERDVYTGDCVQLITITRDGMSEESFQLRED